MLSPLDPGSNKQWVFQTLWVAQKCDVDVAHLSRCRQALRTHKTETWLSETADRSLWPKVCLESVISALEVSQSKCQGPSRNFVRSATQLSQETSEGLFEVCKAKFLGHTIELVAQISRGFSSHSVPQAHLRWSKLSSVEKSAGFQEEQNACLGSSRIWYFQKKCRSMSFLKTLGFWRFWYVWIPSMVIWGLNWSPSIFQFPGLQDTLGSAWSTQVLLSRERVRVRDKKWDEDRIAQCNLTALCSLVLPFHLLYDCQG